MSRTIRRKNQEHLRYDYTRAFGYNCVTDWIPNRTGGLYLELVEANKDQAFKIFYSLHGDCKRRDSIGERMPAWARRLEEHRFRSQEKQKITRFLKGKDDDVIAEDLAKFPAHWW